MGRGGGGANKNKLNYQPTCKRNITSAYKNKNKYPYHSRFLPEIFFL